MKQHTIDRIIKSLCLAGLSAIAASALAADWSGPAPEQIPPVTVRYEDSSKKVLIVEGANYRVKTRLVPVAIMSVEIDGKNQIVDPIIPGFVDSKGVRYSPQRTGNPKWKTWQGQSYKPASSAAARVNVWNAGPYYWDAHVLDIPLVPETKPVAPVTTEPGKLLKRWDFEKGVEGWDNEVNQCDPVKVMEGSLHVAYEGNDPWFNSPPCDTFGPLEICLRVRSQTAGTAELFYETARTGYAGDTRLQFEVAGGWKWQEIRIPWHEEGKLKRFRIDPPGGSGVIELDHVELRQVDKSVISDGPVVRGEIIFHTFADRLNIEFRVDPEQTGVVPAKANWNWSGLGRAMALLTKPGDERLAAAPMWWVLRPDGKFDEELHPLPAANFTVRDGRYLGYYAASGLYEIEAIMPGLSFNSAYDNPNRRIAIPVTIKGDGRPRRIFCKSISHVGMLPATVLADENGFMLPTPVLSCKNFAGEKEEPDDSAFGNAFFPVELAANEEKRFQILHLFQNWGDHMLKQVSSIRFFNIYWHLSTGVSETTCFTIPPMKLNGVWVLIPDYRPYSGAFWKGQPQHDCQSWPGLLQYQTAAGEVRLEYDKTVFESITPNLAHFTMHFTSSDGAARATANVMEIPQGDEMRTFLKIRYDFTKDVVIKGDARDAFRWLNVNDKATPKNLVYLDEAGKAVSEPIGPVVAKPLGKEFPFIGTHGMPGNQGTTYYSSLVLIRSFKARLAGREQEKIFFSAKYDKKGNYWLTTTNETLTLQAGDYVEAELMLVPHAEGTEPLVVPERERRYYGTEGPTAKVQTGRLLNQLPATVDAVDEVAAVTLAGGTEATPVIVKGFQHWAVPLLWIGGVWQNQQSHGGDGYQVNPDGPGQYRFTFLVKQRQGDPREVIITRAQCSTGISRAVDRSGYLELVTDAERGEFSLKAPALFGPGVNRITADAPVSEFRGTAKAVRQIPLKVTPTGAPVEVTVNAADEQGMDLSVAGRAELEFQSLSPDTDYRLLINGAEQIHRTPVNVRQLSVQLSAAKNIVTLARRLPQSVP